MRGVARWWLVLLAAWAAHASHAQVSPGRLEASEPSVKAAFLYKFAAYVEWPASSFANGESPFVFAILGADEAAAELERIVAGKSIHGHRASVRRVKEGDALSGVHVLFVGRGQSNIRGILRGAQRPGTLVVTEAENALDMGSAINFIVADERVGFEISVEAAERNGLKISSRMLNVARRVVSR
jgi:hypothetical protein